MNTNSLARHYHSLTPRERLPLITAASARKDEAEQRRLSQSAPRLGFCVPDYYGLAEGISALTIQHVLEMLELTALYWQVQAGVWEQEQDGTAWPSKTQQINAALLLVRDAGWQLVCAEFQMDPVALLSLLPGWEIVQRTLNLLRSQSFPPEEATKHLRELTGSKALDLLTPEIVRAEYRSIVEARRSFWK